MNVADTKTNLGMPSILSAIREIAVGKLCKTIREDLVMLCQISKTERGAAIRLDSVPGVCSSKRGGDGFAAGIYLGFNLGTSGLNLGFLTRDVVSVFKKSLEESCYVSFESPGPEHRSYFKTREGIFLISQSAAGVSILRKID